MQQHLPFRSADARSLATALIAEDVPIPAALAKAIAWAEAAEAAKAPPRGHVLDLDLEAGEHLELAQKLVIYGTERMPDHLVTLADQAAREAAEELKAGAIDEVIVALRPAFDEAAAVVTDAARLGITSSTTAAAIIERDDPTVVDAYRAHHGAIRRLNEVAGLRITLSTTLGLAPTLSHIRNVLPGGTYDVTAVDYSVCFVSADGWSADGSAYIHRRPTGGIDWLRLAAGGLQLNTVNEVERLLAARAGTTIHIPADQNPRLVSAGTSAEWEG